MFCNVHCFFGKFGIKTKLIANLSQGDVSLFIVFMTQNVNIHASLLLKY